MINISLNQLSPRHRGAVLISMILMVLVISFIATIMISTTITHQRTVANSIREQQAFESAEAGLEHGSAYGTANIGTITIDADGDGYFNYTMPSVPGTNYSVTFTNPVINNFDLIEIHSLGKSFDASVNRTVYQQFYSMNVLAISPPAGLIAKGTVSLSGSVDVVNLGGVGIWSGSTVSISGAADVEGDIISNDANLFNLSGDQFFNNFFNKSKGEVKNSADIVYTNTSDTNYSALLNGVVGKVIYISQAAGTTATIDSNPVIGSVTQPVIMIVDGNFKFNGNATIYGVVYVVGDWNNTGGGNAVIYGAAIVEGNMSSTGTPELSFDSSSLQNLNNLTTLVKVPGSWRDF